MCVCSTYISLNTSVDVIYKSAKITYFRKIDCYNIYKYLFTENEEISTEKDILLMMKKSQEFLVFVSRQKGNSTAQLDPEMGV